MNSSSHRAIDYHVEYLQDVELPPGWKDEADADGVVAVHGPCPKCLGNAYGPAVVEDSDDETLAALREDRGVVARCACGLSHGKNAECGRWWVVVVASETGK